MEKGEKLNTLNLLYGRALSEGLVRSKQEFAEYLGVGRTSLSSAFSGDERYLTDKLIEKIMEVCCGDARPAIVPKDSILIIPDAARAGTIGDFSNSVAAYECERMVSPIKGADYAIQVCGDSMAPEYPNGCRIIIKKVNEAAFIEWGKVYVLDTENGVVVKQVRRTEDSSVVECVSLNKEYQSFTINTEYIKGWYRVLMVLSMK
ncbi:MAG: S24 family peptidase [Parasporobacterium sp.]|nr:S24 family peptidase [Parasporobacterium sp.]